MLQTILRTGTSSPGPDYNPYALYICTEFQGFLALQDQQQGLKREGPFFSLLLPLAYFLTHWLGL